MSGVSSGGSYTPYGQNVMKRSESFTDLSHSAAAFKDDDVVKKMSPAAVKSAASTPDSVEVSAFTTVRRR